MTAIHKAIRATVPDRRSCIRFKKLEDLNLDVAMELVKQAAKQRK